MTTLRNLSLCLAAGLGLSSLSTQGVTRRRFLLGGQVCAVLSWATVGLFMSMSAKAATFNLPNGVGTGACCNTITGSCTDGVMQADCSGPNQQWTGGATCASINCTAAVCGNGVVEPGEECDGAANAICIYGCEADCTCTTAPNDACVDKLIIADGVTLFDSTGATTDGSTTTCGQVHNDIWFNYFATCDGNLTIHTCGGGNFDTRIAVYDGCGCPPAAAPVGCNDDSGDLGQPDLCGGTSESALRVSVIPGQCYKIRVGEFAADSLSGADELNITCTPPECMTNAECDDALFCTGTESCDGNGSCVSSGDPCGMLDCDEAADSCIPLCRALISQNACTTATCSNPADDCQPRCLRYDPSNSQTFVIDCDCRGVNECYVVPSGIEPPVCAGHQCPPGKACHRTETQFIDDTGHIFYDVCCDCEEVCPLQVPPTPYFSCATLQSQDCVNGSTNDTCLLRSVAINSICSQTPIPPSVAECGCSKPGACGSLTIVPSYSSTGAPQYYLDLFSCPGDCFPPDMGFCQLFYKSNNSPPNSPFVPTGLVAATATQLVLGFGGLGTVKCDCAEPPPSLCPTPLPSLDICAPRQQTDCRDALTPDKCRPTRVLYNFLNLTAPPTALNCDCMFDNDCYVHLDAMNGPFCAGICTNGQPCRPTTEIVDQVHGYATLSCDCCELLNLVVDLTTGVDNDGDNNDDNWTVTAEPPPLSPLPRPATIVNPHPAWSTISGSQWISANYVGPNGCYTYEFCFCLNDDFKNPSLTGSMLADDNATVWLNNYFIATVTNPGFVTPTTIPQPVPTSYFKAGTNCIEVVVQNEFGVVTGFDLVGQVSATNGACCPGSGCISNGDCDDLNACTTNTCNTATSQCAFTSSVSSGQCCNPVTGVITPIDDGNECTQDSCDPITGAVTHDAAALDGMPCTDDGQSCTFDRCDNGVCTHVDITTVPCTTDQNCNNAAGCDQQTCGTTAPGFCDPSNFDGDSFPDCMDNCPTVANDQNDSDMDGAGDPCDGCPLDPNKIDPGQCGCGSTDPDSDGDTVADCIDNCPNDPNPNQADADGDGVGNACDPDFCPCLTATDCQSPACAVDNACNQVACTSGVCVYTSVEYGNVDGSANQTPDLDDILCVLDGFGDEGACPNGDLSPCAGDGGIDLDDILGVLDAFGGADPCGCIP